MDRKLPKPYVLQHEGPKLNDLLKKGHLDICTNIILSHVKDDNVRKKQHITIGIII